MQFKSVLICGLLLFELALVQSSPEDCGWLEGENKCPDDKKEILRDESADKIRRFCCIPESEGEKETENRATTCRTTKCILGNTQNLCTTLPQRKVGQETLQVVETLREDCDKRWMGMRLLKGNAGYCCVEHSPEAMLVSTNGAECHEFPHMALLDLGGYRCGGTIYNKRFIITAAHCIVDPSSRQKRNVTDKWTAVVGRNLGTVESVSNSYKIVEAIPHEGFSKLIGHSELTNNPDKPRTYNDIAVLKLDKDIKFGPYVLSLEIAPANFNPLKYAERAVIVGWGTTDNLQTSGYLEKSNFVIRRDNLCYKNGTHYPEYSDLAEQLFCAGGILDGVWSPTAGAGDSGGPAICRGADGRALLCGVTSFGGLDAKCVDNNDEASCPPSSFTDVSYFRDWVIEKAGPQDSRTIYSPYLYGASASKDKYKHQVHITSTSEKSCGGTLISSRHVVTAAHCVMKADSGQMHDNLDVVHGGKDVESGGTSLKIEMIVSHKDFQLGGPRVDEKAQGNRVERRDDLYRNNVAIIILAEDAIIDPNDLPRLPTAMEDFSNQIAFEVAYPRDIAFVKGSKGLMQNEFTILDKTTCQQRVDRLNTGLKIGDNELCAVEKYSGGSTCDRELGGGLFCKGRYGEEVLCGVQFFRVCEFSLPTGFVDTAKISNWLNSVCNLKNDQRK